jgi:hypothetical protein
MPMEPEDLVIRAAGAADARHIAALLTQLGYPSTRAGAHAFYLRMGYADVCDRSGRFLKTLAGPQVSPP